MVRFMMMLEVVEMMHISRATTILDAVTGSTLYTFYALLIMQ